MSATLAAPALGLAVLVLLVLAGAWVTWALRTRRSAPLLPWLLPLVGLSVLSAFGHATARLAFGTDRLALPLVGVLFALALLALRRGACPWTRRPGRLGLAVLATGLLIGLLPLLRLGYLTPVGSQIDPVYYMSRAEHLQRHGLTFVPEHGPEDVIARMARDTILHSGTRQGDQYLLAVASSLSGLRPHQLFSVVGAAFHALGVLGVFVFGRRVLELRPRVAAVAALLAGLQPLPHYALVDGFFSQTAGMGAFLLVVTALLAALDDPDLRAALLAGLLLGGLVTLYPAYTGLALAIAAAFAGLRLVRAARARRGSAELGRQTARFAVRGLLMAVTALATQPLAFVLAQRAVRTVRLIEANPRALMSQAGMGGYPNVAEMFGIVNRMRFFTEELTLQPPAWLKAVAFLVALAAVALGLRALRPRARTGAGATLLVLLLALAQQRFLAGQGRGFPYGYFKIASLIAPVAISLMVAGLLMGARPLRGWRRAGPALLLGLAALASFHLGSTLLLYTRAPRLRVERPALALDELRGYLPSGEPLLWVDTDWPGLFWHIYLVGHDANYSSQSFPIPLALEGHSPQPPRFALVNGEFPALEGRPRFDLEGAEMVWASPPFRLLRAPAVAPR